MGKVKAQSPARLAKGSIIKSNYLSINQFRLPFFLLHSLRKRRILASPFRLASRLHIIYYLGQKKGPAAAEVEQALLVGKREKVCLFFVSTF